MLSLYSKGFDFQKWFTSCIPGILLRCPHIHSTNIFPRLVSARSWVSLFYLNSRVLDATWRTLRLESASQRAGTHPSHVGAANERLSCQATSDPHWDPRVLRGVGWQDKEVASPRAPLSGLGPRAQPAFLELVQVCSATWGEKEGKW